MPLATPKSDRPTPAERLVVHEVISFVEAALGPSFTAADVGTLGVVLMGVGRGMLRAVGYNDPAVAMRLYGVYEAADKAAMMHLEGISPSTRSSQ